MSADPSRKPGAPQSPRPDPPPQRTAPQRSRFRPSWWWIAFALSLLVINYWAGSRATQAQPRVRVPYSPFFLQQVQAGNVSDIRSKGTAIQGTFRKAERYNKSEPTTLFKTEIPAFADTDAL